VMSCPVVDADSGCRCLQTVADVVVASIMSIFRRYSSLCYGYFLD
jgi:hypothetical protein